MSGILRLDPFLYANQGLRFIPGMPHDFIEIRIFLEQYPQQLVGFHTDGNPVKNLTFFHDSNQALIEYTSYRRYARRSRDDPKNCNLPIHKTAGFMPEEYTIMVTGMVSCTHD